MVYRNVQTFVRELVCRDLLVPITDLGEVIKRVGIIQDALHEAGAREDHLGLVDSLYERLASSANVLIDAYNGVRTRADNFIWRPTITSVQFKRKMERAFG